jgi:protein tyrosine/serine phosphatase
VAIRLRTGADASIRQPARISPPRAADDRPCHHLSVSITGDEILWLPLDGAVNARAVVPKVLLRSDNLQGLTEDDVAWLVEKAALEVVVDLRTDVEVSLEGPNRMTAHPHVRVEHRSLYPESGDRTDLDADAVRPSAGAEDGDWSDEADVVQTYMRYMLRRPDSIVGAVRTIARADGAVLVHCAAGKDRTGVVVALALEAAGVPRVRIVEDYLATAARISEIMERLVSSSTYRADLEGDDPDDHAPLPGAIERVLDLVGERWGGAVAWLTANGLEDSNLSRLRRRLAPQ